MARASERAQHAIRRSAELRETLRRTRTAQPDGESGRNAMTLLHLAAEESARSVYEQDRFLAVASHELRQPLNAAQAALQVLEASRTETEAARARAVLRRQLGHMARLVEHLLDLSRFALETGDLRKSALDLRMVIEAALETTSSAMSSAQLTLDVALPGSPLSVHGDEPRLVQVLTNLLSNAVRYTPHGGRLQVMARREGDFILCDVVDNGRGIDPADLPHLFEPFTRGRSSGADDGLGIGLAVVRGIVERHGGTVQAVSAGLGQGSCFTVKLPAA